MYVPQVVPQSLPIASAAGALSATTVGHSSQPEIYSSSYMAQLQAQVRVGDNLLRGRPT